MNTYCYRYGVIEDFHFHYDTVTHTYVLDEEQRYFSKRYCKTVIMEKGMESDGASGPAEDVVSLAWWVHDKLCKTRRWSNGSHCSPWQRSVVLYDILLEEGRWFRARSWFLPTLAFEAWREYLG